MIPGVYELVLLALGGFRLVRLIGWDSITEPLRTWLTGETDDGDVRGHRARVSETVSTMLRCPWCVGFWVALGIYGLWLVLPTAVLVVCVPLALSALFGLIAKNLDE